MERSGGYQPTIQPTYRTEKCGVPRKSCKSKNVLNLNARPVAEWDRNLICNTHFVAGNGGRFKKRLTRDVFCNGRVCQGVRVFRGPPASGYP